MLEGRAVKENCHEQTERQSLGSNRAFERRWSFDREHLAAEGAPALLSNSGDNASALDLLLA